MGCGSCKGHQIENSQVKPKQKYQNQDSPQKNIETACTFNRIDQSGKNSINEALKKEQLAQLKTQKNQELPKESNKVNQKELIFVKQTITDVQDSSSKIPFTKEFLNKIYKNCLKESINTHGAAHEKQEIKRQDPKNVAQNMLKSVYSIASVQRINVY